LKESRYQGGRLLGTGPFVITNDVLLLINRGWYTVEQQSVTDHTCFVSK
jgi:hypothetical protein